jgi:hypothetical protein
MYRLRMKAGSIFALAIVALLAVPPASAAELNGWAYRAVRTTKAFPVVTAAAERGDARAQGQLGFMYATGRGVAQNYTLASYWYRRSAEQGNAAAQHLLGLMYDKGFGVPPDYVLAHMWLNLAAARTKGDVHEDNIRLRDAVAGKMSLGQLADAQYLDHAPIRLARFALEGCAEQAELALDRIVLHALGDRAVHRGVEPAHAVEQRERAVDQVAQPLGEKHHRVVGGAVTERELDLGLFLVGLGERHLAFLHGAVQQQPGSELHQPGREAHALGRVGERGGAFELLGVLPAVAVEIARGLLDQRHAFLEQAGEGLRTRELLTERNRSSASSRILGHDATPHTHAVLVDYRAAACRV